RGAAPEPAVPARLPPGARTGAAARHRSRDVVLGPDLHPAEARRAGRFLLQPQAVRAPAGPPLHAVPRRAQPVSGVLREFPVDLGIHGANIRPSTARALLMVPESISPSFRTNRAISTVRI